MSFGPHGIVWKFIARFASQQFYAKQELDEEAAAAANLTAKWSNM